MADLLQEDGAPEGEHRVLMIASASPPTGGLEVQPSAKYTKYLPQFGWQPLAFTHVVDSIGGTRPKRGLELVVLGAGESLADQVVVQLAQVDTSRRKREPASELS